MTSTRTLSDTRPIDHGQVVVSDLHSPRFAHGRGKCPRWTGSDAGDGDAVAGLLGAVGVGHQLVAVLGDARAHLWLVADRVVLRRPRGGDRGLAVPDGARGGGG